MTPSIACLFSALILGPGVVVDAFPPSSRNVQRLRETRLGETPSNDCYNDGGDGGVENTRRYLSKMWDNSDNDDDTRSQIPAKKLVRLITDCDVSEFDTILPPPPPLTTAERDRRLAELKLLEELATSDDSAQELQEVWAAEKGAGAKERLDQAAEMLEAGQIIAAESMLLKLVDDYGAFWVEPLNRLATVYFRQGRFEESYQLGACVLHMKPWHFDALEGIVTVFLRLCDRDKARSWAEKGLPKLFASTSFPPFASTALNPKRAEWVADAIKEAQEALSHLEYQTQRDFLGTPEEYYSSTGTSASNAEKRKVERGDDKREAKSSQQAVLEEEDDAWQ